MVTPEPILTFWLDQVDEKEWYVGSDVLDAKIRDQFYDTWKEAQLGTCGLWLTYPSGCLAYVILNDQFPRNMFRGSGQAFSSDRKAIAAAKAAIDRGWDLRIDEPARQFFYTPLMHSENLCDQDRAVRLFLTRMPETGDSHLLHAKAHREIIRKFGRFPTRNEALERANTTPEAAFIQDGGYGAVVRELQSA